MGFTRTVRTQMDIRKSSKIKILEITCKTTDPSPLYIQNTHKDIMEYLK